ncbi:hypothetical protein F2P81_024820 [Scophthalmus maximus]|uniref:Uncharacterized protein n=1 Tax=Scophthalmus maximus TaxID=52904 RepID=A0A6A4RRE0_SCOMX|nr:hypothetical protein F2P81_024820 [Scophthalmus maximus]
MNTVVTHTSALIQYNEERGDLISSVLDAVLSLNGFHQPTRLVHLIVFGRSSSFGNIRPLETCRASSSSSEGSVFDERAIRGLVYDFWEDSLSAQQEANMAAERDEGEEEGEEEGGFSLFLFLLPLPNMNLERNQGSAMWCRNLRHYHQDEAVVQRRRRETRLLLLQINQLLFTDDEKTSVLEP